ncbi:enoyl-CoA hydratase/isomerase family protein [Streptomyces sp. NPDC088725]|uniref:enoyl-CoA hydratase/isomerase family protein n=1 Tax=Streptomyces sp. NPDC088725 TaxID=3365873 RepID=UPI0037F57B70
MEQTRHLARTLGGLAGELGTALHELEQIECGAWKGKTALAFTHHISTDVTPLIRKSHDSFEKAARALNRWAGQLQEFQEEANSLDKRAGTALEARAEVESREGDLGPTSMAVHKITGEVYELMDRYKAAAALISKDLDKAANIAPDEPDFWEKLVHGVSEAWNATGQWIKDHADMIKLVGDLLSDLTGVLAFLAIVTLPFEPLGAIFGAAALLTSGLALLSHSIAKAAGADVSWMTMGLDSLGLLPGVGAFSKGGVVVAKTANLAKTAESFGKGFTGAVASGRNLMAFGQAASAVRGGRAVSAFGKTVTLWGTKEVGVISHESATMNRLAGVAQKGYHRGQTLGTKTWNLLSPERLAVDPLGARGIAFDATLKIAPKFHTISQHIGEAVNPGDRFNQSAASH